MKTRCGLSVLSCHSVLQHRQKSRMRWRTALIDMSSPRPSDSAPHVLSMQMIRLLCRYRQTCLQGFSQMLSLSMFCNQWRSGLCFVMLHTGPRQGR